MKKLLAGCLALAMLVSTMLVMSKNVQAADNNQLIDESGNYAISDYWTAKTKKAPTKDGYVFGGWYVKDGDNFVALNEWEK